MYNKIKQKPKNYSLNCKSRAVVPQITDKSNQAVRERNMKNIDAMKQMLKELCAIPSVQGEPEAGKPFGAEVNRALEYFLKTAENFGFETINYDGYAGEVIWRGKNGKNGEPAEELGILCHLDVVKAGRLSDWKYPPFTPTEEDGKIYARGTLDDKGPAVVILYVMKELKEEGFVPEKTIRFVLGCNEESGWGCIDHINKVSKLPDTGFSPDGNFPVVYAEKGILHADYSFECDKSLVIAGGEMPNMVCDYAFARSDLFVSDKNIAAKVKTECEKLGLKLDGDKIESFGQSAHGSMPENGKNAIAPLLLCLAELGMVEKSVYRSLFEDFYNLKQLKDETGPLTMSPDIIKAENGKMNIIVDFRYPASLNPEKAEKLFAQIAPYELVNKHQTPLYVDRNGELVQKLLAAYNEETGNNDKPIAIGGGTYARALKNGVAFGPEFPGEDAPVHQPNEFISVENLEKLLCIYKRAVKALCE